MEARFIVLDGMFIFIFENKRYPILWKYLDDILKNNRSNEFFLDTENTHRINLSSHQRELHIESEDNRFTISELQIENALTHHSEIIISDDNSTLQANPVISKKEDQRDLLSSKINSFPTNSEHMRLKERNYIKYAKHEYPTGGPAWWMALFKNKIDYYNLKTKGNFFIISLNPNNYYAIPYSLVKKDLYPGYLDKLNRWVLSIRDGNLCIHGTDVKIPVEHYHNHFPSIDDAHNS